MHVVRRTPPASSLEALFLRYREGGDAHAIAELYDRTAAEMLAVATRLSHDVNDAEDAVQWTFLSALEVADDWESSRPLKPWLLGILTNRVRRLRRNADRRVEAERLTAPSSPPADALEAVEFTHVVDEAISGLPAKYQALLVLRLKHGMSPAEISHALRRAPGTVRMQLSRGMEMLRKALPPIFASSLALVSIPAQGLSAIRSTVVRRAEELVKTSHPATSHGPTTPAATTTLVAMAALVAIGGMALFVGPELFVEEVVAARPVPESVTTNRAATFELTTTTSPVDRTPADLITSNRGGLAFTLSRAGRPAIAAPVRLERLGVEPAVQVTRVADSLGTRTRLEPPSHKPASTILERLSGDDGTCRFEHLESGFWLVHFPGQSGVAEVRPRTVAEVRHELHTEVLAVHGTVRNRRGDPIRDAVISRSRRPADSTTRELLRTDHNGRFTTWLRRGSIVTARKAGFRPIAYRINPTQSSTVDLEIELADGGATITGRVCDATGEGIPYSTVRLGEPFDLWPHAYGVDTHQVRGVPVVVNTDAAGRFTVAGLAPGEVVVRAQADGYGASASISQLTQDREASLTLHLPHAASIHGLVTDGEGHAMVDERVQVRDAASTAGIWATTDRDGRFELTGITPGLVNVIAGLGARGQARTVLEVQAGCDTEWNATLTAASSSISGRVVDHEPGNRYVVVRDDGMQRCMAETGTDGRFRFEVPQFWLDRTSTLLVYRVGEVGPDRRASRFALTSRTGIEPGDHEVELTVPRQSPRSSSVRGVLVADLPRDLGPCRLEGDQPGDRVLLSAHLDAIATPTPWQCEEMPAGHYRLIIGTTPVTEFELGVGQVLDLGTLVVPTLAAEPRPGAGLGHRVVAFAPPPGFGRHGKLTVKLQADDGRLVGWRVAAWSRGAWLLPLALPRGTYRITASDGGSLRVEHELRIDQLGASPYATRLSLQSN